jgi:hypothetical protein
MSRRGCAARLPRARRGVGLGPRVADLAQRQIGELGGERAAEMGGDLRLAALEHPLEGLMHRLAADGRLGRRRGDQTPQRILPDAIRGVVDVGDVEQQVGLEHGDAGGGGAQPATGQLVPVGAARIRLIHPICLNAGVGAWGELVLQHIGCDPSARPCSRGRRVFEVEDAQPQLAPARRPQPD